MRFLMILTPAANWRDGIVLHNQPFMPEHAVYVQEQFNLGNIILAGPFGDLSGGAIIIDVEHEDEAVEFAENDPAVINGIFEYSIKPWEGLMSKFEDRSPNFDQGYIEYKHRIQKDLNII